MVNSSFDALFRIRPAARAIRPLALRRLAAAALFGLALAVLTAGGLGPAWASGHFNPNICLETATSLDAVPSNNPPVSCTAGDAVLTTLELVEEDSTTPAQLTCVEGETVNLATEQVEILAKFISTASERYDVGIFVNTAGLSAKTDSNPNCKRGWLDSASVDNNDLNVTGGSGPYYNAEIDPDDNEDDFCGDLEQDVETSLLFSNTILGSFTCTDSNDDGNADISSCTSWENNDSFSPNGTDNNPECTGLGGTLPGTGSKCECIQTEIAGLMVAATLTLEKDVTIDDGGSASDTDWMLAASGPTNISGTEGQAAITSAPVDPGTYDLSESGGPSGYTASAWVCVGGNQTDDDTVEIEAGDDVVCTITNDDDPAFLTLEKDVTTDDGGGASDTDWTLAASGPTNISGTEGQAAITSAQVDPGTYDLSESGGPSGYTASDWVCVGGTQSDGDTVEIALGDDVTCTITNDDDPPNLTLLKDVTKDNGGTASDTDWTLAASGPTNISGNEGDAAITDAEVSVGTYDLSESGGPSGYTASAWVCVGGNQTDGDTVEIALGDDVTCTITNDDDPGDLTLLKDVENGPEGTASDTDWTLAASGPTNISGTEGQAAITNAEVDAGSYDLSESGGPSGYTDSAWSCVGGNQTDDDTVEIGLGETVTCTITNRAKGMVDVLKKTNGVVNGGISYSFELRGPLPSTDLIDSDTTDSNGMVDFGGVKLVPDDYRICELNVQPGTTTVWLVDNVPVDPSVDDSTYCVDVTVDIGRTTHIVVDNQFPGGDPRTPGYWKNWNTCTRGNQAQTAANNGGAANGFWLIEDFINETVTQIGDIVFLDDDCDVAVAILDAREVPGGGDAGKKRGGGDKAYQLARNLLAAELNLAAGVTPVCGILSVVDDAQQLLEDISFDGTGEYLKGGKNMSALRSEANTLAGILDAFNNGDLTCP